MHKSELLEIAGILQYLEHGQNEAVFYAGDIGDQFYITLEG